MPSDILGTMVFNSADSSFSFRPGPIFASVVVADEINRAPAKTQSALLEAMEERQVTIEGRAHDAAPPVHGGGDPEPGGVRGDVPPAGGAARPLPVQAGRRLRLGRAPSGRSSCCTTAASAPETSRRPAWRRCWTSLACSTCGARWRRCAWTTTWRRTSWRSSGRRAARRRRSSGRACGGPSGSCAASKALAAFAGREYVTPDDVKATAPAVLRHRLVLTPGGGAGRGDPGRRPPAHPG